MPTVRKSKSAFAAAAAPVLLAFGSGLVKMFAGDNAELGNWLVESFTGLAAGVAGNVYHEHSQTREHAATFITGGHLCTHTGSVMEALTLEFAETAGAVGYRKPLRTLAKKLPGLWESLCRDSSPVANEVNSPAFLRKLAESLQNQGSHPALSDESLRTLLVSAAVGMRSLPGDVIGRLAFHLRQRFSTAILAGLTSLHGISDRAFREAVLRFQMESIAEIKNHTDEFHSFFETYIKITDSLDGALQTIHGGFRSSKKDTRTTRNDVKIIKKDVRNMRSAVLTRESDARMKTYLKGLVDGFQGYNEIGIDEYPRSDDQSPPIWKIFVPPACTRDRAISPEEMDAAQKSSPPTRPGVELLPLLASEEARRHVLLGDPGMGKSTLIQRLIAGITAGHNAPGAIALNRCLPIPIILRDIVPHLPNDPKEWSWSTLCESMLFYYKRSDDAPAIYSPWSDLRSLRDELLSSPKAFFLIDGLDEIGDVKKRTAIRNAIWEGFRACPDARWLVTSRIVGYELAEMDRFSYEYHYDPKLAGRYKELACTPDEIENEWGSLILTCTPEERLGSTQDLHSITYSVCVAGRLYLTPFDDARQDTFIANWFRERKTPNPPPGLMGEIRGPRHDGIRVLSRVPNMLSYMAILRRDGRPLPDGRADLYMAISKAYLDGIDKAYRLSEKHGYICPIPFENRLRLLAILAGAMQHRRATAADEKDDTRQAAAPKQTSDGNIVIPESDLRSLLLSPLARLIPARDAEKELTDFLHFVACRCGLLLPRGTGEDGRPLYGFTHLSFLEFFAACYVREELAHQKDMRGAAAEEGAAFDEVDYLVNYPRGPFTILTSDLHSFAARPEWHEVLIFLAEFYHNNSRQRDPILRHILPGLKDDTPVPVVRVDDLGKARAQAISRARSKALLPLPAVTLAIKLARDQHLNLPPATKNAWFVRLWDAYLSWSVPVDGVHFWPVNALLLDRPANETLAINTLREASRRHEKLSVLLLDNCAGLTDAAILGELWPRLDKLSLLGCAELSAADSLPVSLTVLYLNQCKGLSAVDHLPPYLKQLHLSGCTGLGAVDHLPTSLTTLYLNGCTKLSAVDHLPISLTSLYLNDCTGLSAVDHLPASLTTLFLNGCTGLSVDAVARVKKALPNCTILSP